MKKVFLITEFGKPFPWTDKYIENIGRLGEFGWYWKIFTPNKYENVPDNVEIVNMNTDQFNDLVENKTGVRPQLGIVNGRPNLHITDYYVFSGLIFEDHIKDFDFWGITNMDVVYGRLDHFVSDRLLENCDVFTDDVETINGVFCLWRNEKRINNICKLISNWKNILGQGPCEGCVQGGEHKLYVSDEIVMTNVMKEIKGQLRYRYPLYYPWSSHDRLEIHVPKPKLKFQPDGSLWELMVDTKKIDWEHARPFIGREILYYHFNDTKKYPQIYV